MTDHDAHRVRLLDVTPLPSHVPYQGNPGVAGAPLSALHSALGSRSDIGRLGIAVADQCTADSSDRAALGVRMTY